MNIELPAGTITRILPQNQRAGGVILQNNSGVDIYLGGADVTADGADTGGYLLTDGRELALSDGAGADLSTRALYAVHADAGTVKLAALLI